MATNLQLKATPIVQTLPSLRITPFHLPTIPNLLRATVHFFLSSDETGAIRDAHIQKHCIPFSLF